VVAKRAPDDQAQASQYLAPQSYHANIMVANHITYKHLRATYDLYRSHCTTINQCANAVARENERKTCCLLYI
jgi:hypothetical protein